MGIRANRKLDTVEAADLRINETRSGRAVWDNKGNSTWEWQTQPGVFTRDIDTLQLKALLGEDLKVEDYEQPDRNDWGR